MLCFLLGMPSSRASADTKFWMSLTYDDYPTSPLKEPFEAVPDLDVYNNDLDFEAAIRWSVGDKGSEAWVRFLYGWFVLDYGEHAQEDTLPRFDKTTSTVIEMNYRARYNSPWGWQARLAPGWGFQQFKPFSEESFVPQGGIWGLRELPSGWLLGLGGVHTSAFGSPEFLPSLIAEYDGDRVHVDVELPTLATVMYDWRYRMDFGAVLGVTGFDYDRELENFPDLSNPSMIQSVASLTGAVGYHFDDQLYLRFEAGYMFDRLLRLVDGTDVVLNFDLEEGPFYRFSVKWGGG